MPDKHALLGASSAERWLNCTPSARINAEFHESRKEAAEEGTRAHDTAEKLLKGLKEDTDDLNVKGYVEFVRRTVSSYKDSRFYVELQVDYSHIAPGGFGTSDIVITNPDVLHIIDYKNGDGVRVEAEHNSQLKLYALGAMKKLNFKGYLIRMTIYQPKLNNIKTLEIYPFELTSWGNSIKDKADLAWNGKGDFSAGDHCRFCRFKHLCQEYQKYFISQYGFEEETDVYKNP